MISQAPQADRFKQQMRDSLRHETLSSHAPYLAGLALALAGLTIWLGYSSRQTASVSASRTIASIPADQPVAHAVAPVSDQLSQASQARVNEAYGRLPLSFEANHGQTDARVKFLARGNGYNLFLTSSEAVLAFPKDASGTRDGRLKRRRSSASARRSSSGALRMKLVGANAAPQADGLDELPGKVGYFLGNDPSQWRANIPTYARVRYKDVYPGVDLIYYGNQQRLEYDFVIAPGADPQAIRLSFKGARRIKVDAQGDLVLGAAGGELRLRKPVIFQEVNGMKREIAGGYRLRGQQVGFQVEAYDQTQALVIDPILVYSTYLGGSDFDQGNAIAVSTVRNAYVTGFTHSLDFPAFSFVITGGARDAFVTKLNAEGTARLYSVFLGGVGEDEGRGVALDVEGSAYVTGFTRSSNFPRRNALPFPFRGGDCFGRTCSEAFITKLTPDGALDYSTYLGGERDDEGNGIAVDHAGNVYVTGRTRSGDFPTVNAFDPVGDLDESFVTKLNPAGSALVYSTHLGIGGTDIGVGIAVDAMEHPYILGRIFGLNRLPVANGFQTTPAGLAGFFDAFVLKFNPSASAVLYATYLGGGSQELPAGIAVDAAGNAYVTGVTRSTTDFPVKNAIQSMNNGGDDLFVTKINTLATGADSLVYSTFLGGGGDETGGGIAVDAARNVYVTGGSSSSDFRVVKPLQATLACLGGPDAVVAQIKADGSDLVYSTFFGGCLSDQGLGIAVDRFGTAYITGRTNSPSISLFPIKPSPGAVQPENAGIEDAFIARIDSVVFDGCLQDDHSGDRVRVNLATGEYEFFSCNPFGILAPLDGFPSPFPGPGRGKFTRKGRGSVLSLEAGGDCIDYLLIDYRRVEVRLRLCFFGSDITGGAGTARTLLSRPFFNNGYSITDSNINNSRCTCR